MHPIEALNEQMKNCEPCRLNAVIIEFEELPEELKADFSHYEKEKQFIIYCKECNIHKLIPEKIEYEASVNQ